MIDPYFHLNIDIMWICQVTLLVTKVCQAKDNAKVLNLHGLKQQIQSFDYLTQEAYNLLTFYHWHICVQGKLNARNIW
jgi:hypothetical protein